MAGVRQFDEELMLQQALELFWQKGYANTTARDIVVAVPSHALRGLLPARLPSAAHRAA